MEHEPEAIWTALRRRKVVQWAIAYVAGSWGVLQGLEYVIRTFGWPAQLQQLTTLALLIGLPIVLVLAWYHGDRGEQRVRGTEFAIITLLFLAGGGIFWLYDRSSEKATAADSTAAQPAAPAAPLEAAAAPDAKSIAVLPFVDMSAAKDQEYMSDGIAEELLNVLAKIPDLKVIARTSSFAFKGEKIEIAEIARRLNVAHVLEGSVRTSGKKLRITAQLIRTADSTHLWSETYDRTLDDIFAVQDEIAGEVVDALKVTLLGSKAPTATATDDLEAYNLFLQGRALAQRVTPESSELAIDYLTRSLKSNPQYAPAWLELANVHFVRADWNWVPYSDAYPQARFAVEKALALDPELGAAHAAMGWVQLTDWEWTAAEESLHTALQLEPGDADILRRAGWLVAELGRLEDGLTLIRKSLDRDPLSLIGHDFLSYILQSLGRYDEGLAAARKQQELSGDPAAWAHAVGEALLAAGKAEEALKILAREPNERRRLRGLSHAYYLLGRRAEADAALTSLEAKYGKLTPFRIAEIHARRGEVDLAFQWLDRAYAQHDPQLCDIQINSGFQPIRSDPRYRALLKKMKFPE